MAILKPRLGGFFSKGYDLARRRIDHIQSGPVIQEVRLENHYHLRAYQSGLRLRTFLQVGRGGKSKKCL